MLTVELESGDKVYFVGTHLEHQKDSLGRIDQVKKINEVFLLNKYPTIPADDLNDLTGSKPIAILKKNWTDPSCENAKPTFPSDNLKIKIGYVVYRRNSQWKVIRNNVICDTIASDHCALLTVLKLNP